MSVRKEKYLVKGVKFGEDFTDFIFEEEDTYCDYFFRNGKGLLLPDGNAGFYTFFGIIEQISDGFNDWDENILEIDTITKEETDFIESKFKELFPNKELPEIKNYYVPHYT